MQWTLTPNGITGLYGDEQWTVTFSFNFMIYVMVLNMIKNEAKSEKGRFTPSNFFNQNIKFELRIDLHVCLNSIPLPPDSGSRHAGAAM